MKFFSRKKARKVDVVMSMEDRNKFSDEFAMRTAKQFLPSTNELVDFSSQIPHKNASQLNLKNTLLTTQPIMEMKESSIQESYGTVNVAQSTAINTSLRKVEGASVFMGLLIASVFVTVLTIFGALASLLFSVLININLTAVILLATIGGIGIYIFSKKVSKL